VNVSIAVPVPVTINEPAAGRDHLAMETLPRSRFLQYQVTCNYSGRSYCYCLTELVDSSIRKVFSLHD
jgi:hypothetical protein